MEYVELKLDGSLAKAFYYAEDENLKGIGSSSNDELIIVEDVIGQAERTTRLFNSRLEFLNAL